MTPAELREAIARELPNGLGIILRRRFADIALRVVREAMREPSDEMQEAAASAIKYDDMGRPISWNHTRTWRAMLAASPLREPGA